MSDILFDTATLAGVVAALPQPVLGFSGKYFRRVVEADTPEIFFDIAGTDLRMSPFVSPLVPGQIVLDRGFQTKMFRPAYIKDKTVFTPQRSTTRRIGERIGGELKPAQRLELAIATDLANKLERLERRLEWMAVQAIYYGKVTVSGDFYPARVVDFGRKAQNTQVKTSGNLWGEAGIKPLEDLHTWSALAQAPITDWYLTTDAYAIFRKDPDVKERMDRTRGDSTFTGGALLSRDLTFMGTIDGFNIWVIPQLEVEHSDGTVALMVPNRTVIGIADAFFEGVRHFGAIQDLEFFRPGAYYTKSWTEPDPSVRYMLLQSAPLMVPYRPDSSFRATV